jgi:hypothetical protein
MKLNNSELPSESRTKPKSATLDIVSVPIDHLQRLKNRFGPKTAPSDENHSFFIQNSKTNSNKIDQTRAVNQTVLGSYYSIFMVTDRFYSKYSIFIFTVYYLIFMVYQISIFFHILNFI